jgi:hypothetical protein
MMAYTSPLARDAIREAGGIQPLVALLSGEPDAPLTAKAAAALWYLSRSPLNKEEIRRAGGIALLVKLVGSGARPGSRAASARPGRPSTLGNYGRPGSPVGEFGRAGSPVFPQQAACAPAAEAEA